MKKTQIISSSPLKSSFFASIRHSFFLSPNFSEICTEIVPSLPSVFGFSLATTIPCTHFFKSQISLLNTCTYPVKVK